MATPTSNQDIRCHFLWRMLPLDRNLSNVQLQASSNGVQAKTSLLMGLHNGELVGLLFQAAITCCEYDGRALFITRKPLTEMPLSVHCMPGPSTTNMAHLDFLYVQTTTDLMKLLASLQEEVANRRLPTLIVVHELHTYVEQIENLPGFDRDFAMLLSLLKDVSQINVATGCSLIVTCSKTDICMKSVQIFTQSFCQVWNVRSTSHGYALDRVIDRIACIDSIGVSIKNGELHLDTVTSCNLS